MFLGCDMPIQLVLSGKYDDDDKLDDYDRLEDRKIVSPCTDSPHGLQSM